MAENTKIEWCDFTFNSWSGCTKVSEGCRNCYAAVNYSVKMRGVRFLSVEPLLGPVDFRKVSGFNKAGSAGQETLRNLWIIVGGESGPSARPCRVEWIRSIVEQCKAADVPVFTKQMGAALRMSFDEWNENWQEHTGKHGFTLDAPYAEQGIWRGVDKKGGDMSEWPPGLRVRQFPKATGCVPGQLFVADKESAQV